MMYISEVGNCLSNPSLSYCGLFENTLQQKPVSAERTGKAGEGGEREGGLKIFVSAFQ